MKTTKKMAYKKPRLITKNNPTGSFAAGCPTHSHPTAVCSRCEISQ